MNPAVSIILVAHDSAADLPMSLASAVAQRGTAVETIVVDAASRDDSREVARRVAPDAILLALPENVGFSAAMNAGIEASRGRYVLALNPDCVLAPDFAAVLASRLDARPDAGSASGRILRAQGPALEPTTRLDSAGIVFRASGRHFDRGSELEAAGRYLAEEEVAGTTGAAGFYRREALESARISTGYFDADFFLYREDADLAWRLSRLGWKCLYVPGAVAWHRRRNLPSRRREMTAFANFHSVKNRFLLRINNQRPGEFFRTLVPTLARDLVVLGACLTVERSSLPAFGWLWKNRRRLWAKRREIARLPSAPSPSGEGRGEGATSAGAVDSFPSMRLAILGTRGIPARYGGFETLAEELSARLVERGHGVTVYTRTRYAQPGLTEWRGARVRVLPTFASKYLDTVVHGALSGVDAALERFDAVLVCNAINAAASFLPRLSGRTRVVLNVDGLERERRKWNAAGRAAYLLSERLSTIVPDAVVSDARVIQKYYQERYGVESVFIPYGGDLPRPSGRETLDRLGLQPERYVLYVSRLEPENNADAVVRAYRDVPGTTPLVVVGDAPYAADYIARVKGEADARVLFPGAIYGEGYRELLANTAAYVQATEVGGTHPALVEALGYGRVVCYHQSPENEEVASEAGLPFDVRRLETLTRLLTGILDNPGSWSVWKERARARVEERYRWEDVASRYEAVLDGRPVIS